ncbi:hypothetical protein DPMN_160564 [Dreissena polymorpha]|uniref:Uncharacterized protein n=1 Tax=Dreissena polymorpha TaxID=45954 RepID=A0A9D4IQ89_DREPO|nr:hypothetical protein DPMN_160564 [Dreissena polymorpha]
MQCTRCYTPGTKRPRVTSGTGCLLYLALSPVTNLHVFLGAMAIWETIPVHSITNNEEESDMVIDQQHYQAAVFQQLFFNNYTTGMSIRT